MTVSYNLDVSSTSLIAFLKLQLRWRGSIWKSVMRELFIFSFAFGVVTAIYRTNYFLSEQQRVFWDNFAALFDQKLDYIPLTFMLGFFVTIIVGRWNDIFLNIGWVDNTALLIATYVRGNNEDARILRRTVLRYMVLTQVIIFRDISLRVRKRFPTLETVVAAGFMLENEREKYVELFDDKIKRKYNVYFLPIQWSFSLLYKARADGKIGADVMLNELIKSIGDFRRGLGQLCNFDWVPIPLVYPQVVFLAVRIYFFLCLIARQSVLIDGEPPKDASPVYPFVPFLMTSLQFIFYVGWMKVAESLMNPLGEDDDDFECNFLLDRNLAIGLSIVDDCYDDTPHLQKDIFWSGMVEPLYSSDTANIHINPQIGSAAAFETEKQEIIMRPHVDAVDEFEEDVGSSDDMEGALPRGLSRVISVVSVNRNCESRTSLSSKRQGNGILERLRSTLGGGSKINRPGRLFDSSTCSINGDNNDGSSLSILNDLADDAAKSSQGLLTPDEFATSPRRTPSEALPTLAEEDEESQRTRTQNDLLKIKEAMMRAKEQEEKEEDEHNQ